MHNLSLPLRTNSGFLQYFENLAESDPDIQHKPGVKERQRFFRDFDDLTGLHISDFCMLAIPAPARYDGGSDNLHRIFLYDMYILHPSGTAATETDNTIDRCMAVHDRLLAKIYQDSHPDMLKLRVFTYFRWNELRTDIIDAPMFADGLVGLCSSIPMGAPCLII